MDTNAVGSRWTKAVAMRTPVPKCLLRKRNRCGMGRSGKRRAMIGKEHAGKVSVYVRMRLLSADRECSAQVSGRARTHAWACYICPSPQKCRMLACRVHLAGAVSQHGGVQAGGH